MGKFSPIVFPGEMDMATIKGGGGNDVRYGTAAADLIYGYGGNDKLYGRAGADQLWGGSGDDKLYGEAGNDILRGEAGKDQLFGGNGWDILYGGSGNDKLYGEGGTDTLKGEGGNDILKGGSGIAYLYGGEGSDHLYYDPTASDIFTIANSLAPTILDGDAGADTLHINNRATSLSFEGKAEPVSTDIYMSGRTSGQLYFEDQFGSYIETGKFQEIEKIVASGTGNLQFFGFDSPGAGTDVTGTALDDLFFSFGADDTMRGGDGDDRFSAIGGHDTIVSGSGDADQFFFSPDYFYLKSEVDITGFNGAGTVDGDQLRFQTTPGDDATFKVSTKGGMTIFDMTTTAGTSTHVTVDVTGLVEGVDYFFA
jgi:Ca2+-binding RTX toxin-like protein